MALSRPLISGFGAILTSLLLVSSAGAQTLSPQTLQTIASGVSQLLNPGAPAETLPTPADDRYQLPLAPIAQGAPIEVQNLDGLISLSVRDASLRQVLAALAETQQLNLIMASPVDVPVTAKFNRLPVSEVLRSLLESTGHTATVRDGVIYVTSVAAAGAVGPGVQGRRVCVIELDFASAADLQPTVEGLLSPVGQSFFAETNSADNRRTKEMLVIEDLDEYVTRIEEYISQADQPPRQVLLEVNLLEVELSEDHRSGVNFDALSRISGASLSLRSVGMANSAASPSFFIESAGGDLGALIEALISTTDAKNLASPRLLALNGQESRIQIGEQLGFRVTTTTETSTLESVDFLDVGVVLRVTPRITRDGRVLMRIAPEVSSGAVNPDTGLPEEETTELETDVLLTSGQGMIIGGLIQERDDVIISRIPVLGSLPYINPLFQRRTTSRRRTELIVALTPHITPYTPIECERDQRDYARVRDPLLFGPLCRQPRPYEPRLADPFVDKPRIECLVDHASPCQNERSGRQLAGAACPAETCQEESCRRLPPIDGSSYPVEYPTLADPQSPRVGTRVVRPWR
ncbi:type II secretion system protein GspD [Botrimarina hoheduenensis]|uniref:Type II secretion system protein D n=1 Tax=Botrimarina hoheduenensis TaxID=2528000 RepID=A0A5C5VQ44_9BACT|nr:hypothetical protein [Botrimarina hoheduenensis]TWT40153.1 Type II secretion system protein D precursor [Botrimarina hoheduenensis]